jgi:ParB family chromosome partitioning protein
VAKRGLGKGIDALLSSAGSNTASDSSNSNDGKEQVLELALDQIDTNPNQPRKVFDEEPLEELASSIREHGVIQPILVESKGDRFEIIAGERRFRASKLADQETIPAIVRDINEEKRLEYAIIENIQREDLNPIDEAKAIASLIDRFSLTQDLVSQRLGKSRSAVANTLRLLKLTDNMQQSLADGLISSGHARSILALDSNAEAQFVLYQAILEEQWSVRQAEEFVKLIQTNHSPVDAKDMIQGAGDSGNLDDVLERSKGAKAKSNVRMTKVKQSLVKSGNLGF